ncbi:PriA [Desulforapulum autotrophicum HRM2]|uniref:Replication restart protein PriA n=1 Tax=Desulforapulum autotrophicum (strain ATCC 43914 / DSM 3382 / VKM B-1955 / HRM2) TaxID=177437 RepID=C0QHU0_DESAH|nr:primosomal protein N' [Desulforapulum autotrophicum]ACN13648.1 PriA [Desulforapulum autotrophicum HRM2]
MENQNFIEIAVALPVHGTFTYTLPLDLAAEAIPGMRVLVPFGNRRVTGYVLGPGHENTEFKAKPIQGLLDEAPLFPPAMIELFRWVSDYYIHPLGEVIKAALPKGLNRYDVSFLSLVEKPGNLPDLPDLPDLSPREQAVVDLLKKKGSVSVKSLVGRGKNPSVSALVRRLIQKGVIQQAARLKKDQIQMKTEKFILPTGQGEPMERMSAKRRQILEIVREKGEISLTLLKQEVPTAPKLVKILAGAGYLEVIERQVFRDPLGDPVDPDVPPELMDEQAGVVNQVISEMDKGFSRYLLSGVTGSGKTEVYLRLVTEAMDRGQGALVLVPEISLISQTERRFRARFGKKIAVLHSGLTMGERLDQWNRIMTGDAVIVIGVRSSVFAPINNLGIIIVDEEHDTSYKQETGLRYNARDIAVVRAKIENIPVVLGSATPSVQSYYNVCEGRFKELKLTKRVNCHPLPEIELVDLKRYKDFRGIERIITPELSRGIGHCLERGEQALIFLNRRGFATYPVCQACNEPVKCKFCDLTMTLHMDTNEFRCHLCGFSMSMNQPCPNCNARRIKPLGFGTERIENMLQVLFPDARVARLDQDTGSKKGAMVSILKKVKHRTVDIIIGTQMLAKGHDFPFITLVGVICADLSLNFPDFRAGERTFQLLAQVAGRAGRGDRKGRVVMQTYNPEHFSIEASKNQDFVEFYHKEIPFRKGLGYPPVSRIIQLKISGLDKDKVKVHALFVGEECKRLVDQDRENGHLVQILGPIEAGIPKIAMRYRWQILLKSPRATLLNRLVRAMLAEKKVFANREVTVGIDVDPYSMS